MYSDSDLPKSSDLVHLVIFSHLSSSNHLHLYEKLYSSTKSNRSFERDKTFSLFQKSPWKMMARNKAARPPAFRNSDKSHSLLL